MDFEFKLLNKLLDKYEKSKISKDKAKIIRDISLKFSDAIFEGHRNYDPEFEVVLRSFEINKYAIAKCSKDGQFTELVLNLDSDSISSLYSYLKRNNPNNQLEDYKKVVLKLKNECCDIVSTFFDEILKLIQDKNLTKISSYFESIDELNDIVLSINEMSKLEEDVTERVFCAKLFSNSKRFNEIRSKVAKVIREFSEEPFDEEDDVIASLGVIKNTTFAFVKGDLEIELNGQRIDLSKYKESLSLSDKSIKLIKIVNCSAKKLVTVENFTSYELFDEPKSVVIYLGGFHNKVKRLLITNIYNSTKIECFHFGDIDAGGFYILNHLKEKTGINFKPFHMGINELEKYYLFAKPLTDNDVRRLKKMNNDSRFIEHQSTINFMLKKNVKLEQEVEEL